MFYNNKISKSTMKMCDKKLNSGLLDAILFVQDIPTAACVSGNGFVCSLQDNVEINQKPNPVNLQGKGRHGETKVELSQGS